MIDRSSKGVRLRGKLLGALLLAGTAAALLPGPRAAARDPFPRVEPASRTDALRLLRGGELLPSGCLTRRVLEMNAESNRFSAPASDLLALIDEKIPRALRREAHGPDGVVVQYTDEPSSVDYVAGSDLDRGRAPDVLDAVFGGLADARRLVVDGLALESPASVEVRLLELAPGIDGFVLPPRADDDPAVLILDGSPARGAEEARRMAIHQYLHAVSLMVGPDLPAAWSEAIATWATHLLAGRIDGELANLWSARIQRLHAGLLADGPVEAAGNAVWLAFLDENYGRLAVRQTILELALGGPVAEALESGVRQASSDDLRGALREFHLWSVLSGSRSDGRHFSFAEALETPAFASTSTGLPALSVQSDRPVAALGATQVRLLPDGDDGGMLVRFDGGYSATWEVDLLMVGAELGLRRVPMYLDADGRGEVIVPLQKVDEALLLIRNLERHASTARSYSYAAHREPGFPFVLGMLEASPAGAGRGGGILVSWETLSEQQLIGFNVLRAPEGGGTEIAINPVWIPAIGDAYHPTSYRFLDRSAERGKTYAYRIEGVTSLGLTHATRPVHGGVSGDTRRLPPDQP